MKDPAMLLYTSDFLTAAYFLNMQERGQFITIICLQQQHGHLELEEMEMAVGYLSDSLMKLLSVDEDGRYYNERADFEIARRKKYSQRQAEISRKRWAGNATALPIETEKEKEIEIETEKETEKENQEKKKLSPASANDPCGKTCGKAGGNSVESVWKSSARPFIEFPGNPPLNAAGAAIGRPSVEFPKTFPFTPYGPPPSAAHEFPAHFV